MEIVTSRKKLILLLLGSLGFGKGAQPMRGWCAEHYPHWDRKPDVSKIS